MTQLHVECYNLFDFVFFLDMLSLLSGKGKHFLRMWAIQASLSLLEPYGQHVLQAKVAGLLVR